MFTRRKQNEAVPEVGAKAPEFNLPSAQGGQLRLSMRTVRGPVVVAFYRPGNEEDVEWFKALAEKEQEINMASGSVVGIGVAEPDAAREFARASGLKSYLLYDYVRVTSPPWGVLEGPRRPRRPSPPARGRPVVRPRLRPQVLPPLRLRQGHEPPVGRARGRPAPRVLLAPGGLRHRPRRPPGA